MSEAPRHPTEADLFPGVILSFPRFREVGNLIMEIGDQDENLLVMVTSLPQSDPETWSEVISGTIISSGNRIVLGVDRTRRHSVILLENQTTPPDPWRIEKDSSEVPCTPDKTCYHS